MPEYNWAPTGYDATAYARDLAAFRTFAENVAPDMKIVGPAVVGEDGLLLATSGKAPSILKTSDILSASPRPADFSVEEQREAVRRYLVSHHGEQIAEFVEVESGERNDRPKLVA